MEKDPDEEDEIKRSEDKTRGDVADRKEGGRNGHRRTKRKD